MSAAKAEYCPSARAMQRAKRQRQLGRARRKLLDLNICSLKIFGCWLLAAGCWLLAGTITSLISVGLSNSARLVFPKIRVKK
jgi:hypothetical protein